MPSSEPKPLVRSPRRAGLPSTCPLYAVAVLACSTPPAAAPASTAPASLVTSPRLPDFSGAGYHMSGVEPPRLPTTVDARAFGVQADGVTDDTAAILAALAATSRGALELPRGRIVLKAPLRIDKSGVVLRGQGAGQTILVLPESLTDRLPADSSHDRPLGFVDARGTDKGSRAAAFAAPARRGDRIIRVRPGESSVRRGDVVRLRMGNAPDLLRELLGGALAPGAQTPRDCDHYVDWAVAVEDVSGDAITLAHPLRVDVRPEWQPEVWSSEPTLEEIGVEGLTFEFSGAPRRPHDFRGQAGQQWPDDRMRAVYFRGVENGWIRDVDIVDADVGVLLEECRFSQVERVRIRAALRPAPSGHHGLWAKRSQDCLFSDFRVETQLDDDLTVEGFANGNVFMRGAGEAMNLDHHRNAPYDNLFTDLDVGDEARLWKSGGDVDRGPHAGIGETLWNVRGRGPAPALPGALRFDRPGDGGWPLLNLVAVTGYGGSVPDSATVWIDSGRGAPDNLYEAQRAARRSARAISSAK